MANGKRFSLKHDKKKVNEKKNGWIKNNVKAQFFYEPNGSAVIFIVSPL